MIWSVRPMLPDLPWKFQFNWMTLLCLCSNLKVSLFSCKDCLVKFQDCHFWIGCSKIIDHRNTAPPNDFLLPAAISHSISWDGVCSPSIRGLSYGVTHSIGVVLSFITLRFSLCTRHTSAHVSLIHQCFKEMSRMKKYFKDFGELATFPKCWDRCARQQ